MRKFSRRFFCAVFAVFLSASAVLFYTLAIAPTSVYAQEAVPSKQTFDDIIIKSAKDKTYPLESATLYTTGSQVGGIGAMLLGVQDPDSGEYVVKGVVPEMGNAIAMMIKNPPASGELWLADLLQHSPLVPQAYAQGIGFKSLNPILPVWKAFRDLSYVVFVLVFIAIGFMIMFRKNLHGQTVITISNALPNLVITLLLITFSYAIAGFMIDIMYLVIYFITGVFTKLIDTSKFGDNLTLIDIALSKDIVSNGLGLIFGFGKVDLGGSVVNGAATAIGKVAAGLFADTGEFATKIVGPSVSVVGYVIIAVAMFFAVIKTFFELLKSYVTFIISVIFAPFQLLLGALKDGGDFVQWIKNLAATLLPFPVVIVMIFLALALGGSGKGSIGYRAGDTGGFQAPQITVGDGFSGAASGLIALGILMLIPEAVEMSKKWLGAKGLMDEWLPKIGENLGKGWKGGQAIPGIGPTFGGAKDLLSLGAKSAGTAAAGAGVLGLGGTIYGAGRGVDAARKAGKGDLAQIMAGIGGGFVGGASGATIGAVGGGLAPVSIKAIEKIKPVVDKGLSYYDTGNKVFEAAADISRSRGGQQRAAAKRVPPSQPGVVVDNNPIDPNG